MSGDQRYSIHKKQQRVLEDDEKAQIEKIFEHFDYGGNKRVHSKHFGDIMRLLQYNIGLEEEKILQATIDKGS